MFSKAVDYFRKKSHRNVQLGYKYVSVLPPDLKPIYKDFLVWRLVIKIAKKMLYYYHRFIIQRDKIDSQNNTSQANESNSSNWNFREALIALAIGLINGVHFSYPTKRESLAALVYRSICWQMFFEIGILKNFINFTIKHLCWSLALVKLQVWFVATLLKRDSL